MYTNSRRRIRDDRKAIAMSITSVIVILMALGVVAYITYSGIKGGFMMIKEIFNKYGPPEVNESTVFLYTIKDLNIVDAAGVGCTKSAAADTYDCPANKYIDFSVNVSNGGSTMRKINGAITVCKTECQRKGCVPKDCKSDITVRGSDACYLTANEMMDCDAGSYMFSSGTYIVYSAAVCALESDVGCYTPTMREADKIVNIKEFIMITAK